MSMINCGFILRVVKRVLAPSLTPAGTHYPAIQGGHTTVQFSSSYMSPLHNPECEFIQCIRVLSISSSFLVLLLYIQYSQNTTLFQFCIDIVQQLILDTQENFTVRRNSNN